MKPRVFVALVMLVALGTLGCTTSARRPASAPEYRPRAFALAVTVHGVLQPTPQQWAAIQARAAQALAEHGWVLVSDLALADNILRVDFIPDPRDPENSGHARILGIRRNPRIAIASTTSLGRYPTGFSYLGTFQDASWGFRGFSNSSYYGWGDSYDAGYSYGSATLCPPDAPLAPTRRIHPPHRPDPGTRDHCPTPSDTYIRPRPCPPADTYASHEPAGHPPTPSAGARQEWRGTDSPGSRPRTYSRAEPSPSRLDPAYPRAGSPRPERTYLRARSSGPASEPSSSYTRTSFSPPPANGMGPSYSPSSSSSSPASFSSSYSAPPSPPPSSSSSESQASER